MGYAENKSNSVVKNAYVKFNLLKDGVVIGQTIDTASILNRARSGKYKPSLTPLTAAPTHSKLLK